MSDLLPLMRYAGNSNMNALCQYTGSAVSALCRSIR
jgi:hypothetical protein